MEEPPSDISPTVEKLMVYVFCVVGSISLVFNSSTLLIILQNSSALTREIKFLTVFQQSSCLSSNLFFTLLTIPFFYPAQGAGYCMGLLCPYIPYQVLIIFVVFLNMCMFSAFVMMLIARQQLLIMDDSPFKMRPATKYGWQGALIVGRSATFVIINVAMHCTMTLTAIVVLPSSCIGQNLTLDAYTQLKWRERGLNWFIFYGPDLRAVMYISYYGFFIFVPTVGLFIMLPFAHMLYIVWRSRKNTVSARNRDAHIRPAQTIILQFFILILFMVFTFIPPINATIIHEIYATTQTQIVVAEMVFACFTLVNSIVVITRCRTYFTAFCSVFRAISPRKRDSIVSVSSVAL